MRILPMKEIKKSREEQDELLKEYLDAQKRYNETGDKNILWNEMYPYLYELSLSSLKKKLGGLRIKMTYEEAAQDIAISLIARYTKDQHYNKDLPKTLVYLRMLDFLYNHHNAYSKEEAYSFEFRDNTNRYFKDEPVYTSFEDDLIEKLTREGY